MARSKVAVLPSIISTLTHKATDAVEDEQAYSWTHAVMDVGATVCRPRLPRCPACPAQPWCRYASRAAPHETASARGRAVAGRPGDSATPCATREPAAPFSSSNRWLRGRILDRLRAAPDGEWVALETTIGTHGPDRILAAARAMAVDGVVELRPADDAEAAVRARLPMA